MDNYEILRARRNEVKGEMARIRESDEARDAIASWIGNTSDLTQKQLEQMLVESRGYGGISDANGITLEENLSNEELIARTVRGGIVKALKRSD